MRALLAIVCITLSSWAHSADSWLYSDFTGERLYAEIHGGIGMTDEFDAGLYLKRARPLETTYGNPSYHRERYATLQGF